MLTTSFFENWDLGWYSHSDVNSSEECACIIQYFSVDVNLSMS